MAITPIQIDNLKSHNSFRRKETAPYLDAKNVVTTETNVKPLPPQGHLIHDTLGNSVKYFFKDMAYDAKAVKNGIQGNANDHQLGRLNDVGLKLGGVGIATYLASQTTNPKVRLMEYIGLGAFLTSMNLYPKIAINTPAKLLHGYDIDKEYIDDQGRKKSVQQDSNYVPYDMYLGEVPEEDLSLIGDKMGIPKDIKNRNDLIKEQMRKIATQSNTLWMLTAGFATPVMTALLCCGLENYVVSPTLAKARNANFNKQISELLEKTKSMPVETSSIAENHLSHRVEKLLSSYKNQELPKEEFDNLVNIITENLDNKTSKGIKSDLERFLKLAANNGKESVVITNEILDEMVDSAKNTITKTQKAKLEPVLVPTKEELENLVKKFSSESDFTKGINTTTENIPAFREELKNLIDSKINTINDIPKPFLEKKRNDIIETIANTAKRSKSSFVSESAINKIIDFAKVIGEFKETQIQLDKCKNFKFEYAPETVLAKSYGEFEKTVLKVLEIPDKDLKKMRESKDYTKKILDEKLTLLAKDETKYKKSMEKLGKVISELEVNLNGTDEVKSKVLDLISAIENNYNNTAKRLSNIDMNGFNQTISGLVKEDVKTLGNTLSSREELVDLLDGVVENKYKNLLDNKEWWQLSEKEREAYVKYCSNGVGSAKKQEIGRIIERYQGAKNSFYRILHSLELYKRIADSKELEKLLVGKNKAYIEQLVQLGKDILLSATASEHNLKFNLVNNPTLYKDLVNLTWLTEAEGAGTTKQKGYVTEAAKEALGKNNNIAKGSVLDRFQVYISRFKNLVANSNIDFTKPRHKINEDIRKQYTGSEKTRMSFFNLIGQTPIDMANGASGRKYSTQKWVKIVSGITGAVFGVAILSQFGFGKIRNPHNIQKQEVNDANK